MFTRFVAVARFALIAIGHAWLLGGVVGRSVGGIALGIVGVVRRRTRRVVRRLPAVWSRRLAGLRRLLTRRGRISVTLLRRLLLGVGRRLLLLRVALLLSVRVLLVEVLSSGVLLRLFGLSVWLLSLLGIAAGRIVLCGGVT